MIEPDACVVWKDVDTSNCEQHEWHNDGASGCRVPIVYVLEHYVMLRNGRNILLAWKQKKSFGIGSLVYTAKTGLFLPGIETYVATSRQAEVLFT